MKKKILCNSLLANNLETKCSRILIGELALGNNESRKLQCSIEKSLEHPYGNLSLINYLRELLFFKTHKIMQFQLPNLLLN